MSFTLPGILDNFLLEAPKNGNGAAARELASIALMSWFQVPRFSPKRL
jgi:hypothetical protein